jgi:hypothetical protein
VLENKKLEQTSSESSLSDDEFNERKRKFHLPVFLETPPE